MLISSYFLSVVVFVKLSLLYCWLSHSFLMNSMSSCYVSHSNSSNIQHADEDILAENDNFPQTTAFFVTNLVFFLGFCISLIGFLLLNCYEFHNTVWFPSQQIMDAVSVYLKLCFLANHWSHNNTDESCFSGRCRVSSVVCD